ncbi:ACP S-malonyltransferase [Streptomyces sp. DSM 44917]|uniref:[acyl-carrier-protein] S-malonyltransferase n=1 Tax=Streptomyces boetiae TaxID=3075541 RepID=A0ABU2LEZ8_9ACTN|nr:ACP S-malonyltransferase [Streptomyces sp. DSM 44917]MDT0310172.1 ACP S-malonyltransferase [Streptomyces sp. DSM 44917]
MLVLVAPGQGSQAPGFLKPWLDLPGSEDRLRAWSEIVGIDLIHYGTEADAEAIRDTAVAQPLLVAGALLSARALFDDPALPPPAEAIGAVAGHSVGELAAAALAGVLSEEDAMVLVRRRAEAMAEAAAVTETGMAAVLGGDPRAVAARLEELGLTAANNNGGGQIVAAGTAEQLAALAADKPEKAKVIALKVAGAFHTHHMAPAVAAMEEAAKNVAAATPSVRYVSNADGGVVDEGDEVLRRLVSQVSSPVRWDLCMETFQRLGATAFVELCPAGTLTALAKRNLPGVAPVAVKSPDKLPEARELIARALGQSAPAPEEH